MIPIRFTSHRSNYRLRSFMRSHGLEYTEYYHSDFRKSGHFVLCPPELAADAAKLKGCSRARVKVDDLSKCWSGDY